MTDADRFESINTPPSSRGPLRLLLDLFSSIWLGVVLLSCLFVYSAIGSSGVPIHWNILNPASWVSVAQQRAFEMTEFEWFHWWPFDLLIGLICVNIVIATLRRIPFNALNAGVWMIHSGILILAAGSFWYFSTKVEGDAPVNRRRLVVQAPGIEPATMAAAPGNTMTVGQGANRYQLRVAGIDPQWELLSGDDKGKRSYKVSVEVRSQAGEFFRELIADRPEYTQDVIRTGDPNQPMQRAIKALGKPLVDEALQLTLAHDPQEWFFLMNSRALYLREIDERGRPRTPWIQRPIHNLPRYNDYIRSADDVWLAPGDESIEPDPIAVSVPPAASDDPLAQTTFTISRYLRYAVLESRRRPDASGMLDPSVSIRLQTPKSNQLIRLDAFDPNNNNALEGAIRFSWVDSASAIERLKVRTDPTITFEFPGRSIKLDAPVTRTMMEDPELEFTAIDGTEYSYRVENFQDGLPFGSVAIVQIKSPQRTFKRWVFDDPKMNRDMALAAPGSMDQHEAVIESDPNIQTTYRPASRPPAPIMILAGPGEHDLGVMVTTRSGQPQLTAAREGDVVPVTSEVSLTIERYAARTATEVRPQIIPRYQRDRDVREQLSLIGLEVDTARGEQLIWLPHHNFVFERPEDVLRRWPYRPLVVEMPGGKRIELMFSRERRRLPAPVVLDEFQVATHIGGFTGRESSILDWRSLVRFESHRAASGADGWTEPKSVSMNKPAEFRGYWYFQALWDPPDPQPRFQGDPGSAGLNYTVLGVGNRNGVHVQLAGCCIAVLGMMYTFYARPFLKRRRQQAVYAAVADARAPRQQAKAREPVGAAWKVEPE